MDQQIIMNFSVPPSLDDLEVMANEALEMIPDELAEFCENLEIVIDDLPDESTQQELELQDPYEVLALFRKGSEISPGVESKSNDDDDKLVIYRRCLLDYWCECGEDLNQIIRQVIIEEMARNFEFNDEDVEDMVLRGVI